MSLLHSANRIENPKDNFTVMLALQWQSTHGNFIALMIFNHCEQNSPIFREPNKNLSASQVKNGLKED